MDDALQQRLDRLTYLVAGLLIAVFSLGYYQGGNQYLTMVVATVAVGGIVGVVAAGLPSLDGPTDDEDA